MDADVRQLAYIISTCHCSLHPHCLSALKYGSTVHISLIISLYASSLFIILEPIISSSNMDDEATLLGGCDEASKHQQPADEKTYCSLFRTRARTTLRPDRPQHYGLPPATGLCWRVYADYEQGLVLVAVACRCFFSAVPLYCRPQLTTVVLSITRVFRKGHIETSDLISLTYPCHSG